MGRPLQGIDVASSGTADGPAASSDCLTAIDAKFDSIIFEKLDLIFGVWFESV